MSIDYPLALRSARDANPATTPQILANAAGSFGATDFVVYLVDFGQTLLEPMPDQSAHAELASTEAIATTMAGRAFVDQQVMTADRDDGVRVWAPIVEGSDPTGVLAFTLPAVDDGLLRTCAELGILAGYLIAAHARSTDLYNLYRRRHRMSLAASMQWDLLPPLVLKAGMVTVAGLVEPAYDVGGDCFDYAVNGPVLDIAIIDAMGHGLGSAVISSLVMGCYRHDRREGRSLAAMHAGLGSTILSLYKDHSFATGLLGRIEVDSGNFTWTNAGHPRPLLIRNGQVVSELASKPTPPWGIAGANPIVATENLEPGDCLLLYTDGVTEGRTPEGEFFGVDRLIDLTNRCASDLVRPEKVLRQIVAGVREHQSGELADDATVVIVRWDGPAAP
ncbi:MAG TPA: PP2C family protein-serine/threonine phosphatase [Acidimicrobiales bacterium]|nr:PP2C family protein-serine/threonine phosphatase [Acidimicrobiales bacterium]